MNTAQLNRRTFLATTALATAGFWLGGCATSRARRIAANSKMRVGCIGIGGQGGGVTAELATFPNVEIAALCEVDTKYAATNIKKYPGRPLYQDFRVMFEKEPGLDAVMIATPDHWHTPIALAAMRPRSTPRKACATFSVIFKGSRSIL